MNLLGGHVLRRASDRPFGFERRTMFDFVYFLPGWTTRGGRGVFALPVLR